MEIQFNTLEERLLYEGKLSQSQISEIRRVFNLFDTDKNGSLSYNEIGLAIQSLSKNLFSEEDAKMIIQKIDLNNDGIIEWSEFLKVISDWLNNFESKEDISETESQNSSTGPLNRKKLHDKISKFFYQFKSDFNFHDSPQNYEKIEDLENRSDEWNYLGEKIFVTSFNKWSQIKNISFQLIDKFKIITQHLETNDEQNILIGLQMVFELLNITSCFFAESERFQISHYLIKLFDYLDSSVIVKIIKYLHETTNIQIIHECLKIVTLFASGPKLSNINSNSIFHPSKMIHKNFLIQNNILEILLKFNESSPTNVIRDQSLIALGFMAKNSAQIRDMIILQNGLNIVCKYYSSERTIKEMTKISWVLSILAGVSIKVPLRDLEKLQLLNSIFGELLFWRDDIEILTNSLLGLSYTLPFLQIDVENQNIWIRILALLTHPSILVKRSGIIALGRIINNDGQCQILIELNMIEKLSDLLNYNSPEIKLAVLHILKKLIEKGYGMWVMVDSSLLKNIFNCLYQNEIIRPEIVNLLMIASRQKLEMINRSLINFNLLKALIDNLQEFREYDVILSEIYGLIEPYYDLKMFINVIKTLNSLLQTTYYINSSNDYTNSLAKEFNPTSLEKIQKAIDIFFQEIENKKIDFFQLNHSKKELIDVFLEFLSELSNFFKKFQPAPFSPHILSTIKAMTETFQRNIQQLEDFITFYSNSQTNQIELLTVDIDNPTNQHNVTIGINKSLIEILLTLENLYQISPINVYYFVEENSQKYLIKDDNTWQKILMKARKDYVEKKLPKPTIKLIIANPMKKAFRFYLESDEKNPQIFNYEMTNIFDSTLHTNLEKYEILINELKDKTKLSPQDINLLYQSFIQVTSKRPVGKSDGSVSFEEFNHIIEDYIKDHNFAKEIFHLLEKNGLIDFRDFVRLIGILKSDNLEDKLRLYFKTYDLDNNGFLDKSEIYEMLKNSLNTSGYFVNSDELLEKINKIFEFADLNKDGKLSFTEFKQAVSKNYILVNSFWLDPNQIKLNNLSNNYYTRNNPNNYYFSPFQKPFSGSYQKMHPNSSPLDKYKMKIL